MTGAPNTAAGVPATAPTPAAAPRAAAAAAAAAVPAVPAGAILAEPLTAPVDRLAATSPDATAVIEVGERPRTLTWAELRAEADRVSAVLLGLGVKPGESVAFQLPNWAECVTVTLGVLQIGAVVAPIMPVFGEREVAMVLSRSRARVLILPRSFRRRRHADELPGVVREAASRDLPLAVQHVLVVPDLDPTGTPRAGTDPAAPPTSLASGHFSPQNAAGTTNSDHSREGEATPPTSAPAAPRTSAPPTSPASGHFSPQNAAGTTESDHSREEEAAGDAGAAAGWTWHDFDGALAGARVDAAALEARRPTADDVAQLLFTSGTTGEPKGVQHAHRTLGLATAMEVAHLGLTGDDRVYIPSPLAHQTGFLYGLVLSWRLGVAAVVQPIWSAEVALRQAFGQARASFVQAATPFLMDVVEAVEHGEPAPSSLRIFVATGAAVPRELAERATRVLQTAVCGAFGTTETCLGTLSAPTDPPGSAWGTDGRPLDGIRIRIVDDAGIPLPAGREGNYELLSPTMFLGYLDRPDLTAEVFTADGWYKTGDLGIVDADGFLHVTGRVKDVINRGGEKVPVVEIENLLFTHPSVKDVAIVAMPDARLGERACAFVVTADDAEPLEFAEMQRFLAAAKVSKYYWPERLETIDSLPRNPVGKIQKNLLRERVAALVAGSTTREKAEA
ncbi:AMP-binding protein [Herbiconiux daphne]|uniref:AMP-binding protein n=1 Tax=Herbiconiux daphne TaxID=2970914 RepID=A0ABT2H860_9MICO|nr:AMP-binding protein [Herbiconiux daphne]MCS5736145.1 AMP-binding protein [Herbiconiux daphne]